MKKIIVAGAGFVGVCCALELAKKGFDVTLVDRNQPGEEASFGNAGIICNSGIHPLASTTIKHQLPSLATNRDTRFRLHWPHFPSLLPWLGQFLGNCNDTANSHGTAALSYLLRHSVSHHRELLHESNAIRYLNDTGWLRLYRDDAGFEDTKEERLRYERNGVSFRIVNAQDIAELEPHLIRQYAKGIWLDGTPTVTNPSAVCKAYTALFISLGGTFKQGTISHITQTRSGWELTTQEENMASTDIVVAMGASSPLLLKTTKLKNRIAIERGYHYLYQPLANKPLTRSIIDTHAGFVLTPMEMGIRATSAVELVAKHTRPTPRQINALIPEIQNTFPLGKQLLDKPWMGHRPSTPDSLPIIGPTPHRDGLWQAFGHGHLGLTLGPTTGKWIADTISGKPIDAQQKAFLPERFE
ncbi:MAG: FAD-dependent oxidoreductase [Gammaproteobacteria bacterium]|nr:FAD-dependent oxidoreductase [Gammaproteobacteria bacterium]